MAINILYKFRVPFIAGRRHFSNVGFVGLGNMGNYMATNLIKKGYKLTVYDINKSAVKNLVAAGATEAKSAADLAKNSQVVVTMLPTNDHVWDSFTAKDGLLSSVQKDTLFIDSSTIDPSVSQKVSAETKKHGAKFIDGPVSGGVVGARDATLTFMVGGPKDQYERAKSLLEAMGTRVVHCGDVGMGQGGFMTSLMTKDLGLAQAAATRSNTPIPLGSLAHQIYRILMNHGLKDKDFSVVYQYLKSSDYNK
ncbi:hypothetical protein G9C98_002755 [Cotesia typhae]|uniref:3-hydroxyisobutyrate dehydrogenase n=1 Tax=Cotesia typhae TaxID=2053667 RepID=A0A8J5UTI2_9HYME|nr:hypothetical protein G9C98_002755 [Cotesia typhae]